MKKILDKYNPRPSVEENLKNLGKELAVLRHLYPQLRKEDIDRSFFEKVSREQVVLPPGAERWTLRPRWDILGPSYGEAVKRNHLYLEKIFGGINYRIYFPEKGAEELFSSLKQGSKPRAGFREIAAQQGHNKIIIVPVQTDGYAKKPAAQALKEMSPDEFGLGSFAGSIFLLTNPGRLLNEGEGSWFNCPGDEQLLSPEYIPFYGSVGKKLQYGIGHINAADFFCGTATAFVPNL